MKTSIDKAITLADQSYFELLKAEDEKNEPEEEFPAYEEPEIEEPEFEEIQNFHHYFYQPKDALTILLEQMNFIRFKPMN